MQTIILKLAGPMQAWGTTSNFETRHTDYYPSKSAIIGLIAASLGLQRDEDEKIQKLNELDFAVRVDQQGNLLRDYQTVKKYKKNGDLDRTYVTNRYYLEDAVFLVALSHENDEFITAIQAALQEPYYQPYLGRRSLPLLADFYLGTINKNPINALKSWSWQASTWYQQNKEISRLTIYADSHLIDGTAKTLRKDVVNSFSQKNRNFSFRYESSLEFAINELSESIEHDIFDALGG